MKRVERHVEARKTGELSNVVILARLRRTFHVTVVYHMLGDVRCRCEFAGARWKDGEMQHIHTAYRC